MLAFRQHGLLAVSSLAVANTITLCLSMSDGHAELALVAG